MDVNLKEGWRMMWIGKLDKEVEKVLVVDVN